TCRAGLALAPPSLHVPAPVSPLVPYTTLVRSSGAGALALTGHKLGGPYGAGVLLLGRDTPCVPLLHGGGQERDVRSGTLDVPSIHALATAVRISVQRRREHVERLTKLRNDLVAAVRAE